MNILLINPPFVLSEDSPYSKTGATLPPLGLLYIAAYLRKKYASADIKILDSPAYRLNLEKFKKMLKSFCPDVVGMSIYSTTFSTVLKTAKIVRGAFPHSIIVVGGPHATILPEECLSSPHIDIAVTGEGEEVFVKLIECIDKKGDMNKVPNIVYRSNGKMIRTAVESNIINLNDLPMPARDLIDIKLYRPAYGTYKRLPATNMITSRGCPFSCIFCQKNIFGSQYRALSPIKVVEEIELLVKDYGMREVIFSDDVFTMDRKRIETLCDLLIEKRLDFTWSCSTRVNIVDFNLLNKMKKSGCVSVCYGIESGDPLILKKISKGFSLEIARKAIEWTKRAGLETRSSYILGLPGETRKTIERTIEVSLELDTDFVIYNLATPFPGTRMYEEAKAHNLLLYDGVELYDRTDGPHPQIKLDDISPEELAQIYNTAYRRYYIRPKYFFSQVKHIKTINDFIRYFKGFISFLKWFR